MKWLLAVTTVSLLAAGCGHAQHSILDPTVADDVVVQTQPAMALEAPAAEPAKPLRQPGDFAVFRFTGAFRSQPLTVTQRVADRQGDTLLIDLSMDDGNSQTALRLRISDASGELLSVAKIEGKALQPFGVAAYEELMQNALFPTESNDGLIGSEESVMPVAGRMLPVTKTSYRVRVDGEEATMNTLTSSSFSWGDMGGDIARADGTVLYRAELVDVGHAAVDAGPKTMTAQITPNDLYE